MAPFQYPAAQGACLLQNKERIHVEIMSKTHTFLDSRLFGPVLLVYVCFFFFVHRSLLLGTDWLDGDKKAKIIQDCRFPRYFS